MHFFYLPKKGRKKQLVQCYFVTYVSINFQCNNMKLPLEKPDLISFWNYEMTIEFKFSGVLLWFLIKKYHFWATLKFLWVSTIYRFIQESTQVTSQVPFCMNSPTVFETFSSNLFVGTECFDNRHVIDYKISKFDVSQRHSQNEFLSPRY